MKIAVPVWNDCVSTVLDFADCLLVADCESREILHRSVINLAGTTGAEKTACLRSLGIRVLLCGAVSRPLERMITAAGIEIIPFLRGPADAVLEAYLSGYLFEPGFMLPGCRWGGYGPGKGMGRGRHGGRQSRGSGRSGWNA
jgi:predicted Fe-Mo cluster-binding NifX family protein